MSEFHTLFLWVPSGTDVNEQEHDYKKNYSNPSTHPNNPGIFTLNI